MDATTKTQTTPEQKRRFVNYKIRDTFNLPEAAEAAAIPGFAQGLPGVPQIDPLYVFDLDKGAYAPIDTPMFAKIVSGVYRL